MQNPTLKGVLRIISTEGYEKDLLSIMTILRTRTSPQEALILLTLSIVDLIDSQISDEFKLDCACGIARAIEQNFQERALQ
jgi:hypothetical protein